MGVGIELANNLVQSGVRLTNELAVNAFKYLNDQKQVFSSPLNRAICKSHNSIQILPLLKSHIS